MKFHDNLEIVIKTTSIILLDELAKKEGYTLLYKCIISYKIKLQLNLLLSNQIISFLAYLSV